MSLLFSYGTLQRDDVQVSTFGRLLLGERDELPRFAPRLVRIEDPKVAATLGKTHHDNAEFNGKEDSRVCGMVFEVTDDELLRVDEYEAVFAYERIAVALASGREAWVYVHSPGVKTPGQDLSSLGDDGARRM